MKLFKWGLRFGLCCYVNPTLVPKDGHVSVPYGIYPGLLMIYTLLNVERAEYHTLYTRSTLQTWSPPTPTTLSSTMMDHWLTNLYLQFLYILLINKKQPSLAS